MSTDLSPTPDTVRDPADHGPLPKWACFLIASTFVCLLTGLSLPLILLLPVVGGLAYVIYVQVVYQRTLTRAFWLSTYLREDSPVRRILRTAKFVKWLAVATAVPLACVCYVAIYSYDVFDAVIVTAAVFLADATQKVIAKPLEANLSDPFLAVVRVRTLTWFALSYVIFGLAASHLVRGAFTDYAPLTADQIASEVIKSETHHVKLVQHCVRTIKFFDLELLRIRDLIGWPYGWIVYGFMLLPHALPAYGVVLFYLGVERILSWQFRAGGVT